MSTFFHAKCEFYIEEKDSWANVLECYDLIENKRM